MNKPIKPSMILNFSPATNQPEETPALWKRLQEAILPYELWNEWKQHPICLLEPKYTQACESYLKLRCMIATAHCIQTTTEAATARIEYAIAVLSSDGALEDYTLSIPILEFPPALPQAQKVILLRRLEHLPACFTYPFDAYRKDANQPKCLADILLDYTLSEYAKAASFSATQTALATQWLNQFDLGWLLKAQNQQLRVATLRLLGGLWDKM